MNHTIEAIAIQTEKERENMDTGDSGMNAGGRSKQQNDAAVPLFCSRALAF